MTSDQTIPGDSPRAAALRGALGDVKPDQRLRVLTAPDGELRGYFRSIEGEMLVLSAAPYSDQITRIPFATILGVDRVVSHAGPGAGIAAALAAIPFFWIAGLASEWNKELGGAAIVIIFFGLLGVGLVASIGAIIGGSFDRVEPLVVTKPREV